MAKRPSVTWLKDQQTVHIEAQGCIVNIRVGLRTMDGKDVTSVSVKCDQYPGDKWLLNDQGFAEAINLRVVRQ